MIAADRLLVRRSEIAAPAELAARFCHVRVRREDEPHLAFGMLLPKELSPRPPAEPRSGRCEPKTLAAFDPRDDALGPVLDIGIWRPGRDVGLADFVALRVEEEDLEPLSLEAVELGGHEAVDGLVRARPKGGSRIERFLLFRNGDVLARVRGGTSEARWAALAEPVAAALSTFRFEVPRPVPFLEPYEWGAFTGAMPLGFRRPSAWRFEERLDSPWGRQVIEVHDREGGFLRATAADPDLDPELTPAVLARQAADELRARGIAIARESALAVPSPGPPFETPVVGLALAGHAEGGPVEARIACFRSSRAVYAIAALLPGRRADPWAFLGAKRAFDVACQTLCRPDEAVVLPAPPAGPTWSGEPYPVPDARGRRDPKPPPSSAELREEE